MNTKQKSKPAFTLIEILIATAIFSMLMVITSGIVAESSGYQAKISAIRTTSAETRKDADFVSSLIRDGNGNGTVNYISSSVSQSFTSYQGLALFSCDDSGLSCTQQYANQSDIFGYAGNDPSLLNANVLVSFDKVNSTQLCANTPVSSANICAHILIWKSANEGQLYYKEMLLANGSFNLNGTNSVYSIITLDDIYSGQITSTGKEPAVTVKFGGFVPPQGVANLHPLHSYVTFLVVAKTRGYNSLSSTQRAAATIRTMVEARNFGI